MTVKLIALLIMLPFTLVFIYAAIHEYRRYKSKGRATYGLIHDEETGTTHVGGIAEHEESYDPTEFDPSDHNEGEIRNENESEHSRSKD